VDKDYTRWLLAQPWFKIKYQNIHTLVINNFRVPTDTPEHNEMQVRFLRQEYALRLAYLLYPALFFWNSERINTELSKALNGLSNPHRETIKNRLGEFCGKQLLQISTPALEEGYDVSYWVRYGLFVRLEYDDPRSGEKYAFERNGSHSLRIVVEIKPTVGDDFPSVLRQMKASMPVSDMDHIRKVHRCLLLQDYMGEGANREQFVQFFRSQGYGVIFTDDIDAVQLPSFEENFRCK
jgi:hypothetical protein